MTDFHPVNNDHGTHDHDYELKRWGQGCGIFVRVETSKHSSGRHVDARYYLNDPQYHDAETCCGQLKSDGYYEGSPCGKKAKFLYRDRPFCGQHYPPKVFERGFKREDAFQAKMDARRRSWERSDAQSTWNAEAIAALRKIAEGELNDPVGYAQLILEGEPK